MANAKRLLRDAYGFDFPEELFEFFAFFKKKGKGLVLRSRLCSYRSRWWARTLLQG